MRARRCPARELIATSASRGAFGARASELASDALSAP